MTDEEHEDDAEEGSRDALVPLEPGLDPPVRAEADGGALEPLVHAVRAVDHHHRRHHDHHQRVDHQRIPTDVRLRETEVCGLQLRERERISFRQSNKFVCPKVLYSTVVILC